MTTDHYQLSCLIREHLPFNLDLLPATACLVGGAVRDALLNRQRDYLDLDFVLPQLAVETARKIAKSHHAGFVILDQQRQIARVVFENSTVDFALQEGDSLETDLRRRDFTINAIAYNPYSNELIDPLGGVRDLEQALVRMVSSENLKQDPLRLLRAYRQATQLNFTIESMTRSTITLLAPLLSRVAAERVQSELGYLLRHPQGTYGLTEAWKDKILQPWLKNVTDHKIQLLLQLEPCRQTLQEKFNQKSVVSGDDLVMAKLSCLVSSSAEEAELELKHLKYSRAEIRVATTAIKSLHKLKNNSQPMSFREQYFFFLELGTIFPIVALLSIADGVAQGIIFPLIERYLNPLDQIAHPQPLITGNELMQYLGLNPSPLVGKLLTEVQIAQIEEKIATVDEALEFAKNLTIFD